MVMLLLIITATASIIILIMIYVGIFTVNWTWTLTSHTICIVAGKWCRYKNDRCDNGWSVNSCHHRLSASVCTSNRILSEWTENRISQQSFVCCRQSVDRRCEKSNVLYNKNKRLHVDQFSAIIALCNELLWKNVSSLFLISTRHAQASSHPFNGYESAS